MDLNLLVERRKILFHLYGDKSFILFLFSIGETSISLIRWKTELRTGHLVPFIDREIFISGISFSVGKQSLG